MSDQTTPAPTSYRRKYTTRQIIEMTEQRRIQQETAQRVEEARETASKQAVIKEAVENAMAEQAAAPAAEPISSRILEEVKIFSNQVDIRPSDEVMPARAAVKEHKDNGTARALPLAALYAIAVFSIPDAWTAALSAQLNAVIVHGTAWLLTALQVPSSTEGAFLNIPKYTIPLHGDMTVFYSTVLLAGFAAPYAYIQSASTVKRWAILASLIPLAFSINILRLVLTAGFAMNFGVMSADSNFHGVLEKLVYVLTILGVMITASLLQNDD